MSCERTVRVEVALPIRLSEKWVAHGCRSAGVSRPKWDCARETWTASRRVNGVVERIAITGKGATTLRVKLESDAPSGADHETARQIASAIVRAMQWMVRRHQAERSAGGSAGGGVG